MKFLAFYRILPKSPAPVIPIFTDGKNNFRQISGKDDLVLEYKHTPDLSEDRMFISKEQKINTPDIGEHCIYAYEYAENSIAIGDIESIKHRLLSIISKEENISEKCFTILDIANFTENENLIRLAADSCYKSLNKFSFNLSEKWLNGTQLSDSIKEHVRQQNRKSTTIARGKFLFQFTCRKAVWQTLARNASFRNMTIDDYLDVCIDIAIGDGSFYGEFSPNDISKIYDILLSPKSKILSRHMEAVAKIIIEIRSVLEREKLVYSHNILEHLIIEHAQEDGFTKIKTFRARITRNMEKDVNKISKRFRLSKSEARGVIISSILDKADPEFISKVHALVKSKSDKLHKNFESQAIKYYNKYINYIPDL
ncbi:hypothetical protein GB927_005065 [Shinella sp. CPCC 100929]|uniref:Uncharacterized protein n=1 Tax=Shinella lacus TaxID=2654216 RepID=A0ABT1R2R4_9HYPH|nr:hypothetical protein [Shinella lacus]MCQ4629396.1 hypothetical protein [Shinella lacus]